MPSTSVKEANGDIESMNTIEDSNVALEDRLVALDNFELLVESMDNANGSLACACFYSSS